MLMVNIFEAKAKLSEYVAAAERGERVVICNRNRPVAELRAIAPAQGARKLGTAAGAFAIPASFFEPLPDDEQDAFDGGAIAPARASRAAETRTSHGQPGKRRT